MKVDDFSASMGAPLVAAAAFEKTVSIWNLETAERLIEFDTIFLTGGNRLLLSWDGSFCFAADFSRRGVACYDTRNGETVWQRRDIRRMQRISLAGDRRAIYCERENRPTLKLDADSGATLDTLGPVTEIYASPYAPVLFQQQGARLVLVTEQARPTAYIPFEGNEPSVLCAAYSLAEICLSEAGGPVRLFSLESGNEV